MFTYDIIIYNLISLVYFALGIYYCTIPAEISTVVSIDNSSCLESAYLYCTFSNNLTLPMRCDENLCVIGEEYWLKYNPNGIALFGSIFSLRLDATLSFSLTILISGFVLRLIRYRRKKKDMKERIKEKENLLTDNKLFVSYYSV